MKDIAFISKDIFLCLCVYVLHLQGKDAGQFARQMYKATNRLIAVILLCVVGALLRGTFILLRLMFEEIDHESVPVIPYNGIIWWLCADLLPR